MSLALTLPERYSWVLLASVGACWLTFWQASLVGKARKAAAIPYPQAYAEKSEAQASKDAARFNCVQRAHLNTIEHLPQTMLSMLITGLRYPEIAAGLGAVWLLGRVLYTQGYATGDAIKRRRGSFSFIAAMGLVATATWTSGLLALSCS